MTRGPDVWGGFEVGKPRVAHIVVAGKPWLDGGGDIGIMSRFNMIGGRAAVARIVPAALVGAAMSVRDVNLQKKLFVSECC